MWRLLLVSLSVFLVSLFVWFSIYIWGYSRPVFKYTPIELPKSQIFVRGNLSHNQLEVGQVLEITTQGDLFLCNSQACDFSTLSSSLSRPILIILNENKMEIHARFFEFFKSIMDYKNIIFSSQYPVINKLVKEKQASWQFTTPDSEWLRLTLFKGIGLIHVPDMQADIWFSPLFHGKNLVVDQEVIEEMKRRERQVIIRDIKSKEEFELAKSLGVDAVVIDLDLYRELQ